MKTAFRSLLVLGVSFGLWLAAGGALAAPVGPLNYQGRLLNDGVPVGFPTPITANFVVRIYNDPVGGTLKYQETMNGVTVDDGVYSFKVGLGPKTGGDSLWDINLWQSNLNDLYLEITVNGETLSPRQELTSAPHAYTATLALSADALGNKTAAEFDNILEGVCVSGQGKWLDLLNKCLGMGATVINETPATMMQFPDNNFKNLKLNGADLSGTVFGSVNFSGTEFRNTTLHAAGIEGANLTGVVMDNVVLSGPTQSANTMDLTGATFKNMEMAKFNLSAATLDGFSAANLASCPAALPANWICVDMDNPATGRYVLLGPGVNMSANSAAKIDTFGANSLDLHRSIFNGLNLSGANFQGITFNMQEFTGTNLTGASFKYARLTRVMFNTTNLTNADFSNTTINWVAFETGTTISNTNFREANIRTAGIENISNSDFSYAILENITFHGAVSNTNFSSLLAQGLEFDSAMSGTNDFSNSIFVSDSPVVFSGALAGSLVFNNVDSGDATITFYNQVPVTSVFDGGRLRLEGDFGGVTLSNLMLNNHFKHTGPTNEDGPNLHNITLRGINYGGGSFNGPALRYANFTGTCSLLNSFGDMGYVDFTGTDFGSCLSQIPGYASWMFATCPDGQGYSQGSDSSSCLPDQMTPAPGP